LLHNRLSYAHPNLLHVIQASVEATEPKQLITPGQQQLTNNYINTIQDDELTAAVTAVCDTKLKHNNWLIITDTEQ
jgi:hypothetical protein